MNFLKKLFNTQEPNEKKDIVGIRRSIKAKKCIVANCTQGDFNDPIFFTGKTAIFLDVVPDTDKNRSSFTKCNKLFYESKYAFHQLNYDQFQMIAEIFGINENDFEQRFELLPNQLSDDLYNKVYEKLKLDFVSEIDLPASASDSFVILVNPSFWLQSKDTHFRYCGLNRGDRKFFPQEFIHTDEKLATFFAIMLTNRLCGDAGPDNTHFFKKRLVEELENTKTGSTDPTSIQEILTKLASFSFNDFGFRDYYNESSSFGDPEEAVLEKVLNEYLDKIEKNMQEIRLLWFFYSQIHNPPFFITNTSGLK